MIWFENTTCQLFINYYKGVTSDSLFHYMYENWCVSIVDSPKLNSIRGHHFSTLLTAAYSGQLKPKLYFEVNVKACGSSYGDQVLE